MIKKGFNCIDVGPHIYNEKDDYPDFIIPTAKNVAEKRGSRGIVIGGSGQGEAIAANKVKGIRSVVYYGGPMKIITLSRKHNNSNILSLGSRFISMPDAKKATLRWLNTPFSNESRHKRRIQKIKKFESNR